MELREKLKITASDTHHVHLFKEGTFWKAYEGSAYLFIKFVRAYKPIRKTVKCVKSSVVSIGFPGNALESVLEDVNLISQTEDYCVVSCTEDIYSENDFLLWKDTIEEQTGAVGKQTHKCAPVVEENSLHSELIGRIRNFRIESNTPMGCMLFLLQIQQDLNGTV